MPSGTRIPCHSIDDVPSATELSDLVRRGHPLVLAFSDSTNAVQRARLVRSLRESLPEHVVHNWQDRNEIEVVGLTPRAEIMANYEAIVRTMARYNDMCASLVAAYLACALQPEWAAHEHGAHCLFTNRLTGQRVEAPFDPPADPFQIDPYFFECFVCTF